jgi:hypothetical protein
MHGWTEHDAKRFLKALGVTPASVGGEALYETFLTYEHLPEAFREMVRAKLDQLGYEPAVIKHVPLPLRDPALKEAMHTLVEAHRRGFEKLMENRVGEWLAEHGASHEPDSVLQELIRQTEEEFGEYLNYAGRYCRPKHPLNGDAAALAETFSRSVLATYQALQTITGKCHLARSEMLHPLMEKVEQGEILAPVVTQGAELRH